MNKQLLMYDFEKITDTFNIRKGIDQVLIEILKLEQPENIAGFKITFNPIAGDYTKFIKNILIIDGKYEGVLGYVSALKFGLINELNNETGDDAENEKGT